MMDKNTSLYILFNIGDQFCSVMEEEKKAITQAGENGEQCVNTIDSWTLTKSITVGRAQSC